MNDALPPSLAERAQAVVENTARHLIVPASNLVISYLVISNSTEGLWGKVVANLVIVTLSTHVLSWGNKEYLLRAFSAEPGSLSKLWQGSLATRAPALIVSFAVVLALGNRGGLLAWLALWLVLALVYQSLDVVVLFLRRFRLAIAAEILGLAVTASVLVTLGDQLGERTVIMAYALGVLTKTTVVLVGLAPRVFSGWRPAVDLRHIVGATPFFVIGLSGMLQSKADLYAVTIFLNPADVGRYQVTTSLFIAFQSVAGFVLMPFVKDLYRSDDRISHDASRRLTLAGLLLAALSVPTGMAVLGGLYGFDLRWPIYAVGALTVPPVYRYAPLVYLLFKHRMEQTVVAASLAGAAVNLTLSIALMPRFGILGALSAAALSQWLIMVWYDRFVRRRLGRTP